MNCNPSEIGIRIRELRNEHGMTQSDLADYIGTTDRNIRLIESGHKGITVDNILSIACCFGVSTDYLITGKEVEHLSIRQTIHALIVELREFEKRL